MLIRFSRIAVASAMTMSLSVAALAPAGAHVRVAKRHAAAATAAPLIPRLENHVFTRGSATLFNPDGIVVTKHYVFVVYQNNSDADPTKASTIVKYNREGEFLGSVNLLGRCDGMRFNPVTHKLWALLNNDGLNGTAPGRQPLLYTVDPNSLAAKLYHFGPIQPHGGGYDDIAFINGQAFFSASSPTLNTAGVDDKPVVVQAELTTSGTVQIQPILYGNAYGYDATNGVHARLHLNDPDSLAVDNSNDLVLVSEGDQQVGVISHPGKSNQSVTRYALGTGIDDIAWSRGQHGKLFIADDVLNVIYSVDATYPKGSVFVEATAATPVQSFIGTIDPLAEITPLLTELNGIMDPTSLIFVGDGEENDEK